MPASMLLVLVDVVEEVGEEHEEPEEHRDEHHHIDGSPHRQTQVPVLHQYDHRDPNGPWKPNTQSEDHSLVRLQKNTTDECKRTEVWDVRAMTDDVSQRLGVQIQQRQRHLNTGTNISALSCFCSCDSTSCSLTAPARTHLHLAVTVPGVVCEVGESSQVAERRRVQCGQSIGRKVQKVQGRSQTAEASSLQEGELRKRNMISLRSLRLSYKVQTAVKRFWFCTWLCDRSSSVSRKR